MWFLTSHDGNDESQDSCMTMRFSNSCVADSDGIDDGHAGD